MRLRASLSRRARTTTSSTPVAAAAAPLGDGAAASGLSLDRRRLGEGARHGCGEAGQARQKNGARKGQCSSLAWVGHQVL